MSLAQDIKRYALFHALIKRFILPILVIFMVDKGLSPAEIALITTLGTLVAFLGEVPSGSIADTIGHKKSLILSVLMQAISMLCYLGGTFAWILGGSLLYWLSGTLVTGTAEALFYERLKKEGEEEKFAEYHGKGRGFANAIGILSMIFAGITYEIAWYLPFFIGSIQFFIAAYIMQGFTQAKETQSVKKREGLITFFANFKETVKTIQNDKRIFWLMLTTALITAPLFALSDLQQALLTNAGVTATIIGVFYAGKRILGIVSASWTYKVMQKISPIGIFFSCLVLNIAVLILPTFHTIHIAFTSLIMLGGLITINIVLSAYLNNLIQNSSRATILSAGNFIQNTLQLACIAAFTALTLFLPLERGFQIITGITTLLGIFSLFHLKKHLTLQPLSESVR